MDIVNKAEKFVTELYQKQTPETFFFHDIGHTREVVEASRMIGNKVGLDSDEIEILLLSAWFHDVGYLESYDNHEEISIKIAKEYLSAEGYEDKKLESVLHCIAITEVPQNPQNKIESVLCDADMYHLSQSDFYEKTLRLRKELNYNGEAELKKRKYLKVTLDFFNSHEYQTEYGKEVLSAGKELNVEKMKKQLSKKDTMNQKTKKDITNPKLDKTKLPSRGVETMFRLTANNQISLSAIADNKANILITINSIVLSITITMLFGKFEEYPTIIIPTIIFLLLSLTTIVFAILTTRPKISSGTFTKEDIEAKNVNLLFFGNFYKMSLEDYDWAVKEMMKDFDGLYSNMIRDQYYLGKILAKKYNRLRIAYNIFMFGIIFSVLIFIVTILLSSGLK